MSGEVAPTVTSSGCNGTLKPHPEPAYPSAATPTGLLQLLPASHGFRLSPCRQRAHSTTAPVCVADQVLQGQRYPESQQQHGNCNGRGSGIGEPSSSSGRSTFLAGQIRGRLRATTLQWTIPSGGCYRWWRWTSTARDRHNSRLRTWSPGTPPSHRRPSLPLPPPLPAAPVTLCFIPPTLS